MTEELELFSIDMDDQLTIMENTLVDMCEISVDDVSKEMINNLFRAMHTMKGNASMFGFENVVAFAHVAENILDKIRNDNIKLTDEMIETFLFVHDHSRTLIEVTVASEVLDDEQKAYEIELLDKLSVFLGDKSSNIMPPLPNANKVSNDSRVFDIFILPKDSFFTSDMDMFSILKYLSVIGDIKDLLLEDNNIPTIDILDPKKVFFSISFKFISEEPLEIVEAAFDFVKDDIELAISEIYQTTLNNEESNIESSDLMYKAIKTRESNNIDQNLSTENKKTDNTQSQIISSLRVDSLKVDQLINLISEMVIANSKIMQIASNDENTELTEASDTLTSMLEEIRTSVIDIRMVQVGSSFSKFRRVVNDTAKKLGKDIEFVISGEDTELDKTVIEKISDPLVHMLRNSIDHGIESIEKRIQNGKSKKARIDLRAYPDAGSIIIEIEDDGAGIPKDIILHKAIEKGIISRNDILSDEEIFNLIFKAGFSTATEITNVSGRGVGMDVVRTNIENLKGNITITSIEGKGTKMTIRLPLTLAIIDGFLIQAGDTKYIIPLDMVQECIELTAEHKTKIQDNKFINLRGTILPLLDSTKYFETKKVHTQRENIIIISSLNQKAGLIVNELHGEFQTVIKPLGPIFEKLPWVSGGTILGNGEVALILDVPMLLKSISSKTNKQNSLKVPHD